MSLGVLTCAPVMCRSKRNSELEKPCDRDAEINRLLEQERRREALITKLLLLGGPDSGKSTFAKQMRILHMNGFTDSDYLNYMFLIQENSIECMLTLILAMVELNVAFVIEKNQEVADYFLAMFKQREYRNSLTPDMGEQMRNMWRDPGLQLAYEQRHLFYIMDSAKYFLDNIIRIAAEAYRPTVQDILMSRVPTTGIYELEFNYNNHAFRLIDVGGQRSERRKWIHCFDNVTAILFMVDLSSYCKLPSADNEETVINPMQENRTIFKSIVNNYVFAKTTCILFLNKMDIFKDKLATCRLQHCFPNYIGSIDCNEAADFVREQFMRLAPRPDMITCHYTVATDTRCMELIFNDCVRILVRTNLSNTGVA